MNELIIGGRTFGSRLFVGTGKFRQIICAGYF